MMVGHEVMHVAIGPSDRIDADFIDKVAAIIGRDLYDTRRLLAGKIPRIIAHYDDMHAAELTAQSLRSLGLVAIVCSDVALRQPSNIFRANTLKFKEQEIIFWDRTHQSRRMDSANAFLIIKGKLQIDMEIEETNDRMKFSLPRTVLVGGIPVWKRVREQTSKKYLQTECFVRLYDRTSPESSVEIMQYNFDYSFLQTKRSPSSLVNLNTIIKQMKDVFPQTIFNDSLTMPLWVDTQSATPLNNVEITCRLIYLYHQAVCDNDPSA